MTKVLHIARTPLNGHPVWLSYLQRRNGYEAKTCLINYRESPARPYPSDIKWSDQSGLEDYISTCNVLHLHGDITMEDRSIRRLVKKMPSKSIVVQQYYHEMRRMKETPKRRLRYANEFVCIMARKCATFHPELTRLPMVVPFWMDDLQPFYRNREKLKLVYCPTDKGKPMNYNGTVGKGYQETKPILDALGNVIDVRIITDLNWKETIQAKREADIVLDELVTGGYGMSSLEGLALGCIVISGCNQKIMRMLPSPFPMIHATVKSLERKLKDLSKVLHTDRIAQSVAGRDWITYHYNEKFLHDSYGNFYNECFGKAYGQSGCMQITHQQKPKKKRQIAAVMSPRKKREKRKAERKAKRILASSASTKERTSDDQKIIVQVSRTNCAGAIWRIHDAINKYSNHICRTVTFSNKTNNRSYPFDVLWSNRGDVARLLDMADVIHFHNYADPARNEFKRMVPRGKKVVIQYHTHPDQLAWAGNSSPNARTDYPVLIIAQKHARFFPNAIPVPNLVDVEDALLMPGNRVYDGGPLRLIYTPTDKRRYSNYQNTCSGKGFEECMPIMKDLKRRGIIDLQVHEDTPWERLMNLKRSCDVCLDEVVTGGYHLCSLEALSQGLVTMAWLDDKTQQAIHQVVGYETELPWLNTRVDEFRQSLIDLYEKGPDEVNRIKGVTRQWMVDHWHPRVLIRKFFDAYGIDHGAHIVQAFNDRKQLDVYDVKPIVRADLLSIEGSWSDRQVVIWGTGPSAHKAIQDHPWDDNAVHIGVNGAFHLRDEFDAYCIGDRGFLKIDGNAEAVMRTPGVKVFQSHLRHAIKDDERVNFVYSINRDGFSSDLRKGVFYGLSIAYVALQLAAWGGARNVMLVGCEHDYSKGRGYKEKKPAPHNPNELKTVIQNYKSALPILQSLGIRLVTYGNSKLQEAGVPKL